MGDNALIIGIGGGSHTIDAVLAQNGNIVSVKEYVTTDAIMGHLESCLKKLAERAEMGFTEMLNSASIMNYTTAIAEYIISSGKGPRVGLIVTKGFEGSLYAKAGAAVPRGTLVPEELIAGIEEEVDQSGNIVKVVQKEDIYAAAKALMERGAQAVAICLKNAYFNPANEKEIMTTIDNEISRHYLGAVMTLCSHELTSSPDDYIRMCTTVVNSYVHRDSSKFLKMAESFLRDAGLVVKPRVLSTAMGGAKRMVKTRGLDLMAGADVASLFGAAYLGKEIAGNSNIIVVDLGSESTTIGVIKDGALEYDLRPNAAGLPVDVPMPSFTKVNLGGYSIASVDKGGKLRIGPQSSGVTPGPVSYGTGGTEPTVTDAKFVLGYIDPNNYSGPLWSLNQSRTLQAVDEKRDRTLKAIEEKVAKKLKVSPEEAAVAIIEAVNAEIGNRIREILNSRGYEAKDFDLYVVGGAGPAHCYALLSRVGARRAMVFPYGGEFSAFGATAVDIVYAYREPYMAILADSDKSISGNNAKRLQNIVASLKEDISRDVKAEGKTLDEFKLGLQFMMRYEGEPEKLVAAKAAMNGEKELLEKELLKAVDEFRKLYPRKGKENIEVTGVMVVAEASADKIKFKADQVKEGAKPTVKGRQEVFWGREFEKTDVYDYKTLPCGSIIKGPALVELEGTSVVLAEGYQLTVDAYKNGIVEKSA